MERQEVEVFSIRLKQGSRNPDGILAIKYISGTGEIKDATDNTVVMKWQKNKTIDELADFLRRNKLIKNRQARRIKRNY